MSTEEPDQPTASWTRAIFGSPIVQSLFAMVAVTLGTWWLGPIDASHPLVLSKPLEEAPWTVVTSVYAHRSVSHLVGNAIVIATAGTIVSLGTSTLRFHAYLITTGAIAALATVLLAPLFGPPSVVLGASGAGFALIGYLLASNRASTLVLDRISRRTALIIVAIIAAGILVWLGGIGRGLIGHATGAAIGLVAGRLGLLAR